ncbi:MAG: hypothetical protein R6X29_10645 [Acidimicrobiia bacterium]|jgi:hypothetical protein
MALLSDWGFFVKAQRADEFRRWLVDHEASFVELAPPTYEYLGTYLPIWRGSGEQSEYHQLWRYHTDRPPDLRRAAGDSGGAFTGLARDFLGFVDEERRGDEVFRLYRSVESGIPPRGS